MPERSEFSPGPDRRRRRSRGRRAVYVKKSREDDEKEFSKEDLDLDIKREDLLTENKMFEDRRRFLKERRSSKLDSLFWTR